MLVTVYKCLRGAAPLKLRTYLQVREAGSYILRGFAKLKPPAVRTTTFGLHSFLYLAPNAWNKLPDTILGKLTPYLCLNINSNYLGTNRRALILVVVSS